jgi:membrane-bound serine protease (ClpP class)
VSSSAGQDGPGPAVVMRLDGPLNPIWQFYLERGMRYAQDQHASLLILELNTPGGSIDLMNKLVQQIRSSPIPTVVYVSPNGAMAGSAGTLLTLAGDAAAMAPETAIGAASPVGAQGEDIGQTMETKVKEILKATARTLTERRGAGAVRLAEEMIDKARAVSSSEALAAGLIDVQARDVPDLLRQLDGRTVRFNNQDVILHTAAAEPVELPMEVIERFLDVLVNPNLVFVLLAVGVQALLIELSHPGAWLPGFVAAVCLTLAVYGMGILPVNWFGIIFVVLAFVLFILDIKTPTHGALTVAGVASFIIGALVLFNSANVPAFQRVSIPLVVGTGLFLGAFFTIILGFAIRAQRKPILMGQDSALVGKVGVARSDLAPNGSVQLDTEAWTARSADRKVGIKKGDRVEVVAVDGLELRVRKKE